MSEPVACAGCGSVVPARDAATVSLGPGHRVIVCGKPGPYQYRYRCRENVPKKPCLARLLVSREVCPGCGDPYHGTGICSSCRDSLEEIKRLRLESTNGNETRVYAFDSDCLAWLTRGSREKAGVAGRSFCAMLTQRGRWWPSIFGVPNSSGLMRNLPTLPLDSKQQLHGGMPAVELTIVQAEAADALLRDLRRFALLQYQEGYRQGVNLLGLLADGRLGMESFREEIGKWEQRAAEQLARLDEKSYDPLEACNQ